MIGRRHEIARLQSDFYRDWYYKVLNWLIFEIIVMLVLTVFIILHVLIHPPQHYYAAALGGQVVALTPHR